MVMQSKVRQAYSHTWTHAWALAVFRRISIGDFVRYFKHWPEGGGSMFAVFAGCQENDVCDWGLGDVINFLCSFLHGEGS